MQKRLIAIAGAGYMARVRGQAFLETGRAEICAVASRHELSAQACAVELGCDTFYDDYRRLSDSAPDALLIEVPHQVQDGIALWGLDAGLDLLIGGALASSVAAGERIAEKSERLGRVVEAGFQLRYSPVWEEIRRLVQGRELGDPIMAVCMALWDANPAQWYYSQEVSGGMPLTHMSYCYLNAIRWVLGRPVAVSAAANRKVETAPGRVLEESCGAVITFEDGAFASATASYVGSHGMPDPETRFLCSAGAIKENRDSVPGTVLITVYQGGGPTLRSFSSEPSDLVRQADAFLDAIEGRGEVQNPPSDALLDLRVAEAISLSARERITVAL